MVIGLYWSNWSLLRCYWSCPSEISLIRSPNPKVIKIIPATINPVTQPLIESISPILRKIILTNKTTIPIMKQAIEKPILFSIIKEEDFPLKTFRKRVNQPLNDNYNKHAGSIISTYKLGIRNCVFSIR